MSVGRAIPITLALLLALVPAAEAAKRRVPHGFYGVMYDRAIVQAPEAEQDAQTGLMARSGVESERVVFLWAAAQPEADRPPSFDATDAMVARASRHGLRLLPVVIGTPAWAREFPDVASSPPQDPNDYAAYLSALVERYGPKGSFWDEHPELPRRPLREWQIWNEPHLDGYWAAPGGDWAPGYVNLLRAAHSAIKQADPGAKVVLAAVADFVWRHLQDIYDAGARGYFDVVAINFYTGKPSNVIVALKRVRTVMSDERDARRPLWLTEVTWPAAKGRQRPGAAWHVAWLQTDRGMARRLTQVYDLLVRSRRSLRLERAYWYTWSSGYRRGDLFDFGGLLTFRGSGFQARPALRAYQRSARRYQGCAKTSSGRCR